jgi:site-specific DNA recombinase
VGGRPQPPFKVEQNPRAVRVPSHRFHQEVPIDLIEETLDVEVEHPVMCPATAPGFDEGVVR